jgi:archaemetzincin
LDGLNGPMKRAFSEGDSFKAKKAPGGNDWLASHEEPGQTYGQYLKSGANKPKGLRTKLYVLPLGEFAEGKAPDLEALRQYMEVYYHPLEVDVLPPLAAAEVPAKSRINQHSGKRQWKSTDILAWLPRKLPGDAYAMVAVTMTDLYPDESWNFVFGQATYKSRVGVFSFARYHPGWVGREDGEGTEALVLRRSAKVLTHEMGHMFGIRHCIYFECNMNGANHLAESDATPMHLCPVCLRKMQYATGFDPRTRYAKLEGFYKDNDLKAEAMWVAGRQGWIRAANR